MFKAGRLFLPRGSDFQLSSIFKAIERMLSMYPGSGDSNKDCFVRCFADCMYGRIFLGETIKTMSKELIISIIQVAKGVWKIIFKSVLKLAGPISIVMTANDMVDCHNKCKHLL